MQLVIVADNALTAEGIRRALRHATGLRVIGFATSRRDCRLAIASARPDVVLVDDGAGAGDTLARLAEAREAAPEADVILLTARLNPSWLHEAAAAGANATISRAVQPPTLATLVRELVAGTVFRGLTPLRTAAQPASPAGGILTVREREVLQLVAAGASNARIARSLWVTEQTVKFHLSNVYRKLGVANRTEASHYAHVHGLVEHGLRTASDPSLAATTVAA